MTIKTNIIEDDGKLIVNKTQDVEPLLNHINHLRNADLKDSKEMGMRYVGEIPLILAEQWALECGARLGSSEHMEYCAKKLKDPDFKKLLVKGF